MRGGLSPLLGLICEIVNSVDQGKVREFQKPLSVAAMTWYKYL